MKTHLYPSLQDPTEELNLMLRDELSESDEEPDLKG
jgi:hypothetical protein